MSNHAYSLIGAHEVHTAEGPVRLVKVRNPWGQYEWKGAWSDSDWHWTADLKSQVGFTEANDGTFYMSIEDYKNEFRTSTVCKVRDDYHYASIEIKNDGRQHISRIHVPNDSKVFLTVSQVARRMMPKQYGYSPFMAKIMVGRLDGSNIEFIGGKHQKYRDDVVFEADLQAGDYFIFTEVDFDSSIPIDEYVLASYTAAPSSLERSHFDRFFEKALISCAQKYGQRNDYAGEGRSDVYMCYGLQETDCGYGFVYYRNDSSDATLVETVNFPVFKDMKLMPPYQGQQAQVTVPPGEERILVIKKLSPSCSYSIQRQYYFTQG